MGRREFCWRSSPIILKPSRTLCAELGKARLARATPVGDAEWRLYIYAEATAMLAFIAFNFSAASCFTSAMLCSLIAS